MFNAITWQTFVTAALLGGGAYYFITTTLLYHREINDWFKSKQQPVSSASSIVEAPEDNIVGTISAEEQWMSKRSSIVSAEEVRIVPTGTEEFPETIQTPGESELLTGTIADLMQEIKTLLLMAQEYQSGKQECATLFTSLFERYSNLKDTVYASAVNQHICEEAKSKLSFDVQLLEVRSWWEVPTAK